MVRFQVILRKRKRSVLYTQKYHTLNPWNYIIEQKRFILVNYGSVSELQFLV
ncbi:hypothetical protein GXM_01275 [Nostoc sphaeroides CCNUC1]|uniref:Uncharacterized protein n=1 Tax=Nostoc sphaeroides CCNUC1 TaxID=2653204 RepID=A0A5P8VTT9_9NOSO|nr:hypothetical protein GXM_01275 [Nostoc sphaeroides CCNUC1]